MENVLTFIQLYQDAISLGIQVVLLLGIAVLLHRINVTKRKLDKISGLVSDYVTAVMAEETVPEEKTEDTYQAKLDVCERNMEEFQQNKKMSRDEEENRLISAVLQEIFP